MFRLAKLDHGKECLWLTDYIYVTTLYTAQPRLFTDKWLYIHCLHESSAWTLSYFT